MNESRFLSFFSVVLLLSGCGVVAQQSQKDNDVHSEQTERSDRGAAPQTQQQTDPQSDTRADAQYSRLWGHTGELFDPYGRLPDFSYAGYEYGNSPIPQQRVVASVRDFGADGSDRADDTAAFQRAIATVQSGAIEIPAGSYFISDILTIEKPGIVLRGAGSGRTVLNITTTLEALKPQIAHTGSGKPVSRYSWSGGFIWVKGKLVGRKRFDITKLARRGDTSVVVSNTRTFTVGAEVQIEQHDDPASSLLRYLYAGDPGDAAKLEGKINLRFHAVVRSVSGNTVTLSRPLRSDVRPEWSATMRVSTPTVHHVGVEGITVRFEPVRYNGHFTEAGRNAIAFSDTSHCWIRDVVVENCDSGIFFMGTQGTMENITLRSSRSHAGTNSGHHGISLGTDNVLTDFRIDNEFYHDITITAQSAGNVVKNGSGFDLTLDHHKSANYANLFCNLDVGKGTKVWKSGGAPSQGKHTGAWTTFWGIRSQQSLAWPPEVFGPNMMNLVGLKTNQPEAVSANGKWFEVIAPDILEPLDLHAAQLQRRK